MALELEHLTPVIGSEIHGLDLNQADAATAAKIKTALNARLVLVFRDQSLTREAHKRFARFFGTGQLQRHALSRSEIQRSSMSRRTKIRSSPLVKLGTRMFLARPP